MPLHSFLGIVLVLLSLFQGCSREDKEEHAGSDISLPSVSLRIVSVEPEDAAEQVSIQTSLKVVFNSEIDQETVYPGSILLLLQNSTFIQGNHEVNGMSLIFQPQDNLSHSTTYQWSVVSGIRNLNGQMLETTTRMTFKTEEYVDRIPPRLLLVTPQDNASGVAIDTSIVLTFSEPILSESLNAENFSLLDANGQSIPGVFNTSGSDAVFTRVKTASEPLVLNTPGILCPLASKREKFSALRLSERIGSLKVSTMEVSIATPEALSWGVTRSNLGGMRSTYSSVLKVILVVVSSICPFKLRIPLTTDHW